MKKKLLYAVSDIDKALAFEWVAGHFSQTFDLSFILIGKKKTIFSDFLDQQGIRYHVVADTEYQGIFRKAARVYRILQKEKPEIVHVHLWRAMLICIPVSWFLGIKRRIFTRHHATIHYVQYPSGRKWDRLINALATHIVAISQNVKNVLVEMDKAAPHKVHVIHHGFDLSYFQNVSPERIEALRRRHSICGDKPIVGVISRYLELKGIPYIIDAFLTIRKTYPAAHLVLANTNGDYAEEIKEKLATLNSNSFTEIDFEEDLAALYQIFDIFVHTPVDDHSEAFGQTYVEALVSGVPAVFTLSGVAGEFISHERNALVVPYRDSSAIAAAIERILANPILAASLIREGKASTQPFALQNMLSKLEALYG